MVEEFLRVEACLAHLNWLIFAKFAYQRLFQRCKERVDNSNLLGVFIIQELLEVPLGVGDVKHGDEGEKDDCHEDVDQVLGDGQENTLPEANGVVLLLLAKDLPTSGLPLLFLHL